MKFLSIIDFIAVIVLLVMAFRESIPLGVLIPLIIILFLKALIGILSIGGIIDICVVLILIIGSFVVLPPLVFYIGAIAIGQKGIATLFI